MKQYLAKNGNKQFKPSLAEAMEMDEDMEGFCLACGETQPADPDASRDICQACGAEKVYGASELILMGLVHQ